PYTSHTEHDIRPDHVTEAHTCTLTNKDGAATTASTSVVVKNVAPSNASVSVSTSPIDENGSTSLSGSFTDPGTLDSHTVVIDWRSEERRVAKNCASGVLRLPSSSHA